MHAYSDDLQAGETLPDGVDLDDDPFADDLSDRLADQGNRRMVTRGTVVLAALLLLVAGFLSGALVQKHYGTASASAGAPTGAFPSGGTRNFGGYGGTGQGGTSQAAGGGTTGTVTLVDGTTVYITTSSGSVVTIKTNGSTSVLAPGSLKDLAVGSTVTVQGTTATDGTMTATRISKAK